MTIDLIKVLSKPTTNNFRYHVGSLAFGALILTLVQAVRILLEYIDHKTRSKASHLMSTMLRYRPPPSQIQYCFYLTVEISPILLSHQLPPSGTKRVCTLHTVLHEVLLLVPREVHQVSQSERIHHGKLNGCE